MKRQLISKSLMVLLIFLSIAPLGMAQNADPAPPPVTATETTPGDNDHLPFMQNAENPAVQEPGSGSLVLKTLGALLLIVGLIFFGAWVAKRMGFGGTRANGGPDEITLSIVSSVTLGSGRTISTVRFGDRVLLVGSTAQAFTLLAEEATPAELSIQNSRSVAEMLAEEGGSFNDEFEQAQNRMEMWNEKGDSI